MTAAERTNLSSNQVVTNWEQVVGTGEFRIVYAGKFVGGERNQQEAVCKTFKPQYSLLENEYYEFDFKVADKAIEMAKLWNNYCQQGKEIMITKGSIMGSAPQRLVEPLIRFFTKFTSNNGWISADEGWAGEAMEAFSHYTYHKSGGFLLVCDLQGRYRHDPYDSRRCRFELTDPAICSRNRLYGPTDLGLKGIESFFAHHRCNQFCNSFDCGNRRAWAAPKQRRIWFGTSSSTCMFASTANHLLNIRNPTTFNGAGPVIMEEDSDDGDSS
jgi:Alpha-kinase family